MSQDKEGDFVILFNLYLSYLGDPSGANAGKEIYIIYLSFIYLSAVCFSTKYINIERKGDRKINTVA